MTPARAAFGLDLRTDVALPGGWSSPAGNELALAVRAVAAPDVAAGWSGLAAQGWAGRSDGRRFEARIGSAGDLLMTHGELTAWLAPDGSTLLVAGDLDDPVVQRPLLDSVLFTVALWRGRDALHAGAVLTERGVIAVAGPSGAGKSSLVRALLDAGAAFFSDDILVLSGTRALPGPGLMTVPADRAAPADVLAELDGERWVAVEAAPAPAEVAGVVVLETERRPTWAAVLDGLLDFPREEGRRAGRARLALQLAADVPILSMTPRGDTTQDLAYRVLSWIREAPTAETLNP